MAVTQTTIFAGFDRVLNKLVIADTTDYAAAGIDFGAGNTVAGYFKFEYDIGNGWVVIYNNLGGVTPNTTPPSVVNFNDIDLPLDTDGKVLKATYRITYVINVSAAEEYTVTTYFQYVYNFEDPKICLDKEVDCGSSQITSNDVTNYDVPGTTTTSIQRQHTWYPPPTSGLNPVTGTVATLVYSPITNIGTWTAELISNVVYLQPDGLNIVIQLTGVKETVVACSTKLSKVLCCLTTIYNQYQDLASSNDAKAALFMKQILKPTWEAVVLFLAAQSVGNKNKMAFAYAEVLEASQCGDCSCNDDINIIQPETTGGTGFSYQVDSPLNTVAVTQSTAGNVITFHLEVSPSILNIINNIQNLVRVEGDGTYITVTQSGTAPVIYTVSYTGPAIHTQQLVQKQIILYMDPLSFDPNYMKMEVNEINNVGANVAATPHTVLLGLNAPNGPTDIAIVRIQNFLNNVAAKKFIVNASLNRRYTIPVLAYLGAQTLKVECFHIDGDSLLGLVQLRVLDSMNNVVDLAKLASIIGTNRLYISLDIIIEP